MQLTGHTILITGATSGIGYAFAEEFHRLGNKVIVCGRRADRLAAMQQKYPGIITHVCDISNEADRTELANWAFANYPGLNVLINNAGVQYAFNMHDNIDSKKLENEVATNFTAPVHLCALFAAHFAKKAEAAIINISSGLAFSPLAFMPVYCATKAAIHSFTLSLRHQLKDTSIKVFEIAPPSVDTELGHDRRADKSQSHGGLPIDEFLKEAMEAFRMDILEAPIANAKNMHEKREQLFPVMNH